MAQSKHERIASSKVAAWLAHNELNNKWLSTKAGIDLGTVGDFLNGQRWPKGPTQGKIEKALGWPAGSIHQMGQGETPTLSMEMPATNTVGGGTQDDGGQDDYVKAPGASVDSDITNADLLREILRSRAEYDQLRAEVRDVSERVARLEQGS